MACAFVVSRGGGVGLSHRLCSPATPSTRQSTRRIDAPSPRHGQEGRRKHTIARIFFDSSCCCFSSAVSCSSPNNCSSWSTSAWSRSSCFACAEHRRHSPRSEWPQNRKINHPLHCEMDTSRVDGVKAPQHRGTPRSRLPFIEVRLARELPHHLDVVLPG